MATIYTIIDPSTEEVRYVGRTSIPLNERLNKHLSKARHGNHLCKFHAWTKEMLEAGKRPIIKALDVINSSDDAIKLEALYIKEFASGNFPLLNTYSIH